MNVIVKICGQEAIPVRAIPLVSNLRCMRPFDLVRVLAGNGGSSAFLFGDLQSWHLEDGQVQPKSRNSWAEPLQLKLGMLNEKIMRPEVNDDVGELIEQSLKALPAGVFVWKDEYQALHSKIWNDEYSSASDALRKWKDGDGSDDSDEKVEALRHELIARYQVADLEPFQRDLRESIQILKRWEKPDYSPFMQADLHAVVMEGFESLVKKPLQVVPVPPKPVQRSAAQEGAVLAMLRTKGFDPHAYPRPPSGKPCPVKQDLQKELGYSTAIVDKTLGRLRKDGRIRYA